MHTSGRRTPTGRIPTPECLETPDLIYYRRDPARSTQNLAR